MSLSPPLSQPTLDVSGRVFVITGGTQGLGLSVARMLQSNGAAGLVLVSRSESKGQAACRELTTGACHCHFLQADLSDPTEASSVIPRAITATHTIGPISGLVHAAATTARGNLQTTTAAEFDRQMAVNVRAPMLILQAAAPHMPPGSSVVNVASVTAHGGAPFLMAYSTSKAALVALTKVTAAELAPQQIRVNAVNMGWTCTDHEDVVQQKEHPAGRDWLREADATVPLGRILRPTDVAATVNFLLSQASNMMTGTVVDLHPEFAHGMSSCSRNAGER